MGIFKFKVVEMSTLRSRVVVAGEPTVGKTQIIHQYLRNSFNHNYMMTQGCEYQIKEIKSENSAYTSVELHLIDIAGQNIFKEITFDLLSRLTRLSSSMMSLTQIHSTY